MKDKVDLEVTSSRMGFECLLNDGVHVQRDQMVEETIFIVVVVFKGRKLC
ncbi:hypothetical protein RWE15_16055 [Virgibacillus halophilus]|uniref:Uncharacterized protein n=1 Tax=Tigheibacillus halophilus TaxID=361280 RepID=A0ABU5C8L0_9BACI|nr:hypothetical protein [Virgibacillus halophilus]